MADTFISLLKLLIDNEEPYDCIAVSVALIDEYNCDQVEVTPDELSLLLDDMLDMKLIAVNNNVPTTTQKGIDYIDKRERRNRNWFTIRCWHCGGHGVVASYTYDGSDFLGADFCPDCGGSRALWVHRTSGVVCTWPGGPFVGRLSPEAVAKYEKEKYHE